MSWFRKLVAPKIKREATQQKKAVPEGLWSKCSSCEAVLYFTDLENNLHVCPKCSFHNRLTARQRLDLFLDPEGRAEATSEVLPLDPLKFKAAQPVLVPLAGDLEVDPRIHDHVSAPSSFSRAIRRRRSASIPAGQLPGLHRARLPGPGGACERSRVRITVERRRYRTRLVCGESRARHGNGRQGSGVFPGEMVPHAVHPGSPRGCADSCDTRVGSATSRLTRMRQARREPGARPHDVVCSALPFAVWCR